MIKRREVILDIGSMAYARNFVAYLCLAYFSILLWPNKHKLIGTGQRIYRTTGEKAHKNAQYHRKILL
jgi:hypothetical protein